MENTQAVNNGRLEYSHICTALPHKQDRVDEIVESIRENGWYDWEQILLIDGAILDGRHRYEAANIVGVEPTFKEFEGTVADANDDARLIKSVKIPDGSGVPKEVSLIVTVELVPIICPSPSGELIIFISNDSV